MAVFYHICRCIVWPFAKILYPIKVIGKKNTPKGRAILACNHTSNLDIVILDCCRVKRPFVLAKHTLFKNKFLGWCFKKFGGIPVNRQDLSTATVRETIKVLEQDNHLILFPEGTRKETLDETTALKNGMALFALKTNSPIVPMYMAMKPKLFRFNKLFIGEPIDLSEFEGQRPKRDVLDKVSALVMEKMQEMKRDYEATLSPKKLAKLEKQRAKEALKLEKRIQKRALKNAKKIELPESVEQEKSEQAVQENDVNDEKLKSEVKEEVATSPEIEVNKVEVESANTPIEIGESLQTENK